MRKKTNYQQKNEESENMIEFEIFGTLWYLVAVFFMIGWFLSYFCFSFSSVFFGRNLIHCYNGYAVKFFVDFRISGGGSHSYIKYCL